MSSTVVLSLGKRLSMPRSHPTTRRPATRLKLLAVVLLIAIVISQTLPRPSKKRCTPTSPESYCPQPMQCVDSKHDHPNPRPLVVIAAGGERAASTFLYNALRILLRIRDPNTVSGWYVDLKHMYNSYAQIMPQNNLTDISQGDRLNAFRSIGSLLVKIHTVRDWHDFLGGGDVDPVMDDVDAVFSSYRDIRDAVRSIRDMGWGVSYTDSHMLEKDFCRRKQTKKREIRFFKREDYKHDETWVTVARRQIRCRQVLLESAGSKLKMDLKAEDVFGMDQNEMRALLQEMSSSLNYTYSDAELDIAVQELRRLRPVGCNHGYDVEMSVNPLTHLHKGHIRSDEDQEDAKSGMMAIERDPDCRRWLIQHLYDVDVHYSDSRKQSRV